MVGAPHGRAGRLRVLLGLSNHEDAEAERDDEAEGDSDDDGYDGAGRELFGFLKLVVVLVGGLVRVLTVVGVELLLGELVCELGAHGPLHVATGNPLEALAAPNRHRGNDAAWSVGSQAIGVLLGHVEVVLLDGAVAVANN